MRFLIIFGLVAVSLAAPQGYSGGGGFSSGGGAGGNSGGGGEFSNVGGAGGNSGGGGEFSNGEGGGGGFSSGGNGEGGYSQECANGEILHVNGQCARPIVTRNIFLFTAPQQLDPPGPPPVIPPPRVDYNLVFVRTPEQLEGQEPIVVPPPQQKTLVYVLNKNGQRVVEVPAGPAQSPEVYYVNYNDGDNPTLPGGIDLQTALNSASSSQGQVIGEDRGGSGGESSGGSSVGSSGGSSGGSNGGGYSA